MLSSVLKYSSMEYFKNLPVTDKQQEFEDGLSLACDIDSRILTAITPEGRRPVSKTFIHFVPAIVYENSAGKRIGAPLRSLDPKFVTRGLPDPKVLWHEPNTEGFNPEPTLRDALSDLRSAMLLETLADEAAEPNANSLSDFFQDQADKMSEPDILVNSDQQEIIANKINDVTAWVLSHGKERAITDTPEGVVHYKTASVGMFNVNVDADIEDILDNAYLSLVAEDEKNNVKINLIVSQDPNTYDLEINFTNVAKSVDLKFKPGNSSFEKMTAKEFRILSGYLDQFIKTVNAPVPTSE